MSSPIAVKDRREAARHQKTGRFGEHQHLTPEPSLRYEGFAAEQSRRDADAEDRKEVRELLKAVQMSAAGFAYRRGILSDSGDIAGDALIQIISQHARGTATLSPALGVHVAQKVGWTYLSPGEHHEARSARRLMHDWFDTFIQEHGRMPSTVERAAEAERIRLGRPAGSRPPIGFENKLTFVSMEADAEDGEGTFGDTIPDPVAETGYASGLANAAADAYEDLEDELSGYQARDARKNLWNLLAGTGPGVAVKGISDDREHRAAIERAGGALAVARAWAAGETPEDDSATLALFAPFGNIHQKAREEVVDILSRNAGYAEQVWDCAMTAALDVQKLRVIKRREQRHAAAALAA